VLETSRLWRKVVQEIAAEYSDVTVDYMFVDNAAMQIILNPAQFDVVLTENMFGDIISDEASVLSGSLGLLPSASVGNKTALFEPIHGSYPQAAGKDIANPLGSILSAAMLLDHFQLTHEAAVRAAVAWTLANGFVSKDIDAINNYSTTAIGDLITDHIERNADSDSSSSNASLNQSTII
jgi:3-isopropylmalate dehydrogenase